MGWGVHDYPEPPPEYPVLECGMCHDPLGEDGAFYIEGDWCCPDCTKEYIDNNFTTWEIAAALDIEHRRTEDIL